MKDTIIRYYWIAWDNRDGTEDEAVARTLEQAEKIYAQVERTAPYVKLVACYHDRDETLKHS